MLAHIDSIHRRTRLAVACLGALAALAAAGTASAAPTYTINKVLVAEDQYTGEKGLDAAPLFKPHDARTSGLPGFWMTSNERTGCAGITVFANASNKVLAKLNIDEPGVAYAGGDEAGAGPCVGTILEPPAVEPPEGTPGEQFPDAKRFSPDVCIPVVLPPGQASVPTGLPDNSTVKSPAAGLVCAPLGAESHARHPHGVTIDFQRKIAYQVIEHSGLRWNADRTAFVVATTTDEESGMTVAYDVADPKNPQMLKAYLNGHGAHEIVVNQNNGLVFQGNHEDSPGVTPSIWVDVIDPTKANPYGFIDTGYFNAIQGIDVDEAQNIVYGTTHVGEKTFAFDGSCAPMTNPDGVVPPPAPPGYTLPGGDNGMKTGWNCVYWWADIRPAFLAANPDLAAVFGTPPAGALPNVLHFHNLAVDDTSQRVFQTIHSIHDAEHTGLAEQEPPPGASEEEEGAGHHYMGRWVAEVGPPTAVDPSTKKATAPVSIIDLSNGYGLLAYPNVGEVIEAVGLTGLLTSFVHAHFIAVDPTRKALLVSGEHTGNLGVVDLASRLLKQVLPITRSIPGCVPPPPEEGDAPDVEEPHVHGVTVQPLTGKVYVSDEGEHCFYESVTVLTP